MFYRGNITFACVFDVLMREHNIFICKWCSTEKTFITCSSVSDFLPREHPFHCNWYFIHEIITSQLVDLLRSQKYFERSQIWYGIQDNNNMQFSLKWPYIELCIIHCFSKCVLSLGYVATVIVVGLASCVFKANTSKKIVVFWERFHFYVF